MKAQLNTNTANKVPKKLKRLNLTLRVSPLGGQGLALVHELTGMRTTRIKLMSVFTQGARR